MQFSEAHLTLFQVCLTDGILLIKDLEKYDLEIVATTCRQGENLSSGYSIIILVLIDGILL